MKIDRARAAWLAFVLAGIAAALAGGAILRRPPAPARGPVLVLRSIADAAPGLPMVSADGEDRAMALAVSALATEERQRLLELLDYTTARLEAKLSPLATDFDDGDPVAQLRASLAPYLPAFTAARELERGTWQSADLAVRVAASCADAKPASGERCITLWDPEKSTGDGARRARFFAWSAAQAVVLDLSTRERAEAHARALRTRATRPSSTVALVLLDDNLALQPSPDRAALQAAAYRLGRAMAANGVDDTKDLEAFARAVRGERVAPWLRLSPTQVLVVPRLSALGRRDELRREIAP